MDRTELTAIWNWIKNRLGERTTWDGGVIILICLLVILASPLIKWVAWAGVAYGVYTVVKAEVDKRRE